MRPIVVFMDEKKRATLRNGGGLPDAWFTSFDEIGFLNLPGEGRPALLFWPYKVDYYSLPELTDSEKPFDVISYLGEEAANNQETMQQHDREVYSAFCNTIAVHVVFLDAKVPGDESEYLRLDPLDGLARWGWRLKNALDRNFSSRPNASHILVVVVSGEEIKPTKEASDDFCSMLKGAGFSRCYILNHDLGRGSSGMSFHASDVWKPMLERLLLYFVLSEEAGTFLEDGQEGRIFVWQAFECRIPVVSVSSDKTINNKVAEIADKILAENLHERLSFGELPNMPDSSAESCNEDLTSYKKFKSWVGWSKYPVGKLVAQCLRHQKIDSKSWDNISQCFESIGILVSKCHSELSSWLSEEVHEKPAVKRHKKEIEDVLAEERNATICKIANKTDENENEGQTNDAKNSCSSIRKTVTLILKYEQERQEALRSLQLRGGEAKIDSADVGESLAESVRQAQEHYVGLFKGLCYFGVVAAMAGWVIWRTTMVFGGTDFLAMLFSLSFAIGGLVMLLYMWSRQRLAGDSAVDKLCETAGRADTALQKKDMAARKLQFYARVRHCHLVRIGMLAGLWQQLERAYKVLGRELKVDRLGRQDDKTGKCPQADLQRVFDDKTVTSFAQIKIRGDDSRLESEFKTKITEMWKEWCKQQDNVEICGQAYSNGFFPVASLWREVRNFITTFQKTWKRETLKEAMGSKTAGASDILTQLLNWCVMRHNEFSSEFASADVKDAVLWPMTRQYFYIPSDPQLGNVAREDKWKRDLEDRFSNNSENLEEKYEIVTSDLIDECRAFALFYRELAVHLDIDDRGVLVLRRNDEQSW